MFHQTLEEIEDQGYEVVAIFGIPACAVNAPHQRMRYWIVCRGMANAAFRQDNRRGTRELAEAPGRGECGNPATGPACESGLADAPNAAHKGIRAVSHGSQNGLADTGETFWNSAVLMSCADGKVRRAPDDSQRMAHGIPVELLEALAEEEGLTEELLWKEAERFGDVRITGAEPHRSLLGALGNSIVWQLAAEIIRAIVKSELEETSP